SSPSAKRRGENECLSTMTPWKARVDVSPTGLASARAAELAEMAKDFWSPRSVRYNVRRRDFVRKAKTQATPLRFATHRRRFNPRNLDEEEANEFDDVVLFERKQRQDLENRTASKLINCLQSLVGSGDKIESRQRSIGKVQSAPIFSCYYSSS